MTTTKLKKLRMAQGFTQVQVASKCGIGLRHYQALESGERNIRKVSATTVIRMAQILNVSPASLIED